MTTSYENSLETSALDRLYQATSESLTADTVQAAINELDPHSPFATMEAEEVLGFAAFGANMHPEDDIWAGVLEGAGKVYRNRVILDELVDTGLKG